MLVLLSACSPAPLHGVFPVENPSERDEVWLTLVDEIETTMAEDLIPGLAMAVVLDGRLAYARGFGRVRTWEDAEAVDEHTLFRWGSVSKVHTSMAALRLEDQGVIGLDDRVQDWVPTFRPNGGYSAEDLTLRQLMTHTGGLPDALEWRCDRDDASLTDWVADTYPWPSVTPPGELYNYSNLGYTVLGAVLQVADGRAFPDLVAQEVFEPAGMRTATFRASEAVEQGHAFGHALGETVDDPPVVYELEQYDCARGRPAGWIHGSVLDLARSLEIHLDGGRGVLSADRIQQMWSQRDTRLRGDGSHRYGLGLHTGPYKGVDLVTHDGFMTGFESQFTMAPEHGFGIVIVTNSAWADTHALRNRALDLFLGLAPDAEVRDRTYTAPETFAVWEGTYEQPWAFDNIPEHAADTRIVVRLDGRHLLGWFEQSATEVVFLQEDGDAFGYEVDEANFDVRFIEGPTGERWLVNRRWVARRVDPSP